MVGWKNPQPIGLITRTTTASVSGVSEVNGERYSRERVKLEVIAPPGWPVGYPLYRTTDFSPNTRLPIHTRSPLPQHPEISLQHAFFVSHPPPLSQQIAPPTSAGIYRFQPSCATRAATSPLMPPPVEPYHETRREWFSAGSHLSAYLWSLRVMVFGFFLIRY